MATEAPMRQCGRRRALRVWIDPAAGGEHASAAAGDAVAGSIPARCARTIRPLLRGRASARGHPSREGTCSRRPGGVRRSPDHPRVARGPPTADAGGRRAGRTTPACAGTILRDLRLYLRSARRLFTRSSSVDPAYPLPGNSPAATPGAGLGTASAQEAPPVPSPPLREHQGALGVSGPLGPRLHAAHVHAPVAVQRDPDPQNDRRRLHGHRGEG